jgi:hypothetical protein
MTLKEFIKEVFLDEYKRIDSVEKLGSGSGSGSIWLFFP